MKQQTLHMIGNAHIDPVWLWQWQEGFHEVRASFRSALDRMKEYPEFTFVSSSAAYYEWVEQIDPAMFAEIRQRVKEGRWQIVGGWWIQPDCNIPGGESFARHALYAQRYFKEKFGVTARVGYNVDSFGHHGMIPQLLKKAGMDYYVFMRPSPHEKGLPGRLFWWESDDGSRVLTFRLPFEYCTWGKDLENHIRRVAGELKPPFDELMCFYGVGNHGGGPTKENIESIKRLDADPDLPHLVISTPQNFFETVTKRNLPFPVVHEDLQHHASGCYAVHSAVKMWNRRAESLLVTAEKFSAIANRATGQPYPADFHRAWKGVLFNQFHDIMAGTSIEPAYDDAAHLYGEAMSIGGRALNLATQALAWQINIPYEEAARPIVVFNPHAWDVKSNVELEFGFGPMQTGDALLDEDGDEVPFQIVQSQATTEFRNRISFIATLPALGYRTFRIAPRHTKQLFPAMLASDTVVENGRFRLELDPDSGAIRSLHDKTLDIEVFSGPAAVPVVLNDTSDTWSHEVFSWQDVVGTFKATSVNCAERGRVKATLRSVSTCGDSKLVQDFTLYQDLDQIDVAVTVDWREQFKMLKLRFPVNVRFMRATWEVPYGHIERFANGEEEPGQGWIDVSGTSADRDVLYGLSILNDGKYSSDVNVRNIGLTVLRSPIYAHHDPAVPQADRQYSFIDQGIQHFRYTLLPHEGGWEKAQTVRRAAELNAPPVTLITTFHAGNLPQRDSYLAVDAANINVSVVKQWEDGDDLIVRAYETSKVATHAKISLPKWSRVIEADFKPCEIKTFRIPRDAARPIVETNLLEWTE